ncbi:MAG: hypothetical protein ACI9FB_003143 [Candidatus Azotimanducaceae bacterium]|jgi:hypothetical protein
MVLTKFGLIASIIFLLSSIPSQYAYAIEMKKSFAERVTVLDEKITLYKQESVWFGMSCQSTPIGSIGSVKELSVGDTVSLKDETFKIGIIAVNEILEGVEVLGKALSTKGDVICMAASDANKLPSAEGCQALWLHISECNIDEAVVSPAEVLNSLLGISDDSETSSKDKR